MFSSLSTSNLLLGLAVYLLESYAIYRLALVRSLPNPLYAFIPFFQLYMLGMIGDSLKYMNRQVDNLFGRIMLAYALPLISLAGWVLRYPFSAATELVLSFAKLLVYYLVFSFYARRSSVLFTAVCALPTIVMALYILSMFPLFGILFSRLGRILSDAAQLTTIVGPLLILYSVRGRR